MGIKLGMDARDLLDAKSRKALSRAGAFVRQRAKTSIRKRKAISAPGSPPSSHAGHLKRLIWFAYDPHARSVVIGPVQFKEGVAPKLLEFGGKGSVKRKSGKTVAPCSASPAENMWRQRIRRCSS